MALGQEASDIADRAILIVDDDASIRSAMRDYLSQRHCAVFEAGDAREMHRILKMHAIDVVVLDVMLPGEDGLSIARSLMTDSDVGIIMVSALGSESDRVVGLEMGADDYLPKPVSPLELFARIRALQRRREGKAMGNAYRSICYFDGWQLDPVKRVLRDPSGVITTLTDGEFVLLLAFVEHPQQILSRDQLLHLARGEDSDAFDRAIDTQVSRLRRKMATRTDQEIIRTIRQEGYMFMPTISRTK